MTDKLQGFDMVVAITQASMNTQLFALYKAKDTAGQYIIKRDLDINLEESGIELTGTIGSPEGGGPWIEFGVPGNSRAALFYLPVSSGSLKHWVIDHGKPVQKTIDFTDLTYAFKVNLDLVGIQQDDIKNNIPIPPVVKQHLANFTDDLFTVRALFMDFQNADLSAYDKAKSTIPEALNTVKGISDFQSAIENHFTSLSGTKNPYILGYAIDSKNQNADAGVHPTFVPTGATFSTFNDPHNSDLNALNFLVMTNKSGLPSAPGAGLFPENWATTTEYEGAFVLDSKLLFEEWFLPTIKNSLGLSAPVRSGNKWTLSSNVDERITRANAIDYSLGLKWFTGDLHIHTTGVNSVTVSFESPSRSKAEIDISGSLRSRRDSWFYASKLNLSKESVYSSSSLDFTMKITIIAGDKGQLAFSHKLTMGKPKTASGGTDLGGIIEVVLDKIFPVGHTVNDLITQDSDRLASLLTDGVRNIDASLQKINARFVMPAGGVFFFKNPQFNAEGDLLMEISYKTN